MQIKETKLQNIYFIMNKNYLKQKTKQTKESQKQDVENKMK